MSKPTPGPWRIWKSRHSNTVNISRAGTHDFVCEVGLSSEPHVNADARLISAAPDLLEALTAAFIAMGRDGANASMAHPQRAAWESARAAIAKATGV
jgi:hypothetical protein